MVLRVFCLVIVLFGALVYSCSDSTKTKACDAVFSPDAMKITCSPLLKRVVEQIAQCQKKSCSTAYTCSVSQCVVNAYGITTNGKIDETKCKVALKQLTKENPASKPLNDRVIKNCLNGQYKQYVTSDPDCDTMKFTVCAYVNFLMGSEKFYNWPCSCKTLSENVAVCKPFLAQYLKDINSKGC